jgi:glycosyltransferase involved in cell wall biosynthesis
LTCGRLWINNQFTVRILQISSSRTFGGGERHFVDLCRGLQQKGHDVFAALRPTNVWQDRLEFLPRSNILHVSIRNSFGILSANKMAGFVRDNEIEIIHAHVARDYIPASIACTLSGRAKFVLTRHVLFPLKPFNRFALKNLSKAIAVSPGVELALTKVFRPQQIALVANGIDIEDLGRIDREAVRNEFRMEHGILPDALLVGIIGELIELKGQRDFILAANELAPRVPAAHFVVVGRDNSIDQKFRRELKRLVKVFGLEERFLWLDWVDDTRPLFAAMDLFVSASHTESFGMAILEAIASGTPVIATDTDGARELLANPDLLVPIADPVRLAEKIGEILSDSERRSSIATAAMTSARSKYSLDRMITATEKLYMDLE